MSLAQEARDIRRRVAERLRELEPLAREYEELMRVAAVMGIEPADGDEAAAGAPTASAVQMRWSAAAEGPRRRSEAERQPSDPHSPRQAAKELAAFVLEAVRSEPGRTVGDYAVILGLAQTALYRPVRELTDDRMIVKRARQLFPA